MRCPRPLRRARRAITSDSISAILSCFSLFCPDCHHGPFLSINLSTLTRHANEKHADRHSHHFACQFFADYKLYSGPTRQGMIDANDCCSVLSECLPPSTYIERLMHLCVWNDLGAPLSHALKNGEEDIEGDGDTDIFEKCDGVDSADGGGEGDESGGREDRGGGGDGGEDAAMDGGGGGDGGEGDDEVDEEVPFGPLPHSHNPPRPHVPLHECELNRQHLVDCNCAPDKFWNGEMKRALWNWYPEMDMRSLVDQCLRFDDTDARIKGKQDCDREHLGLYMQRTTSREQLLKPAHNCAVVRQLNMKKRRGLTDGAKARLPPLAPDVATRDMAKPALYAVVSIAAIILLLVARADGNVNLEYENPYEDGVAEPWTTDRMADLQRFTTFFFHRLPIPLRLFFDAGRMTNDKSCWVLFLGLASVKEDHLFHSCLPIALLDMRLPGGNADSTRIMAMDLLQPIVSELNHLARRGMTVLARGGAGGVLMEYDVSPIITTLIADFEARAILMNCAKSARARLSCHLCGVESFPHGAGGDGWFRLPWPVRAGVLKDIKWIRQQLRLADLGGPAALAAMTALQALGLVPLPNVIFGLVWFSIWTCPPEELHAVQIGMCRFLFTSLKTVISLIVGETIFTSRKVCQRRLEKYWAHMTKYSSSVLRVRPHFTSWEGFGDKCSGEEFVNHAIFMVFAAATIHIKLCTPFLYFILFLRCFRSRSPITPWRRLRFQLALDRFFATLRFSPFRFASPSHGFSPNPHLLDHLSSFTSLGFASWASAQGPESWMKRIRKQWWRTQQHDSSVFEQLSLRLTEEIFRFVLLSPTPPDPLPLILNEGDRRGNLWAAQCSYATLAAAEAHFVGITAAANARIMARAPPPPGRIVFVRSITVFRQFFYPRENWQNTTKNSIKVKGAAWLVHPDYEHRRFYVRVCRFLKVLFHSGEGTVEFEIWLAQI